MSTDLQFFGSYMVNVTLGEAIAVTESGRRVQCSRSSGTSIVIAHLRPLPQGTFTAKKYIEIVPLTITSTGNVIIGLHGQANAPHTTQDCLYWRPDAAVQRQGTGLATFATYTTSDVIQIAYDPATSKVWFGKNNTWQNSGAPAAGTGALTLTSAGASYQAFCMMPMVGLMNTSSVAATIDARVYAKSSQQTYSPPSGFVAWDDGANPDPSYQDDTWVGYNSTARAAWSANVAAKASQLDINEIESLWMTAYLGVSGGYDYIDGIVDVANIPAGRQVRLYDRESGTLLDSVWSHPTTGYYRFNGVNPSGKYFVIGHDYTLTYNGVIQDNLAL